MFSKHLGHILNMSASMHRNLNHISRGHSITLDSMTTMGDELANISAYVLGCSIKAFSCSTIFVTAKTEKMEMCFWSE